MALLLFLRLVSDTCWLAFVVVVVVVVAVVVVVVVVVVVYNSYTMCFLRRF